jgi:hypothetical protein
MLSEAYGGAAMRKSNIFGWHERFKESSHDETTNDDNAHHFLRYQGVLFTFKSRDSSVGIALGYGLDNLGSGVRFPAGAGNFSLNHRVQKGSGAHPASYPMGTRGSIPGGKASGA